MPAVAMRWLFGWHSGQCSGDALAILWRCSGYPLAMLWLSSGDPLAMLWRSLAILSGTKLDKTAKTGQNWTKLPKLDKTGQKWTNLPKLDKSGQICQNWTEVDNVLLGRFTFDPSKAQTLTEYQSTCPPKLAKVDLSAEASEGGARKGWCNGKGRPCET